MSYLLGSLLGSLVVGWLRGGVDIRKLGSGNAGGTNALRTQGKWFALGVMVIDVGKGILATAVIPGLVIPGVGLDPDIDRSLVLYGVAFAAIVGHVFPVWFEFRGGKGGATAAGLADLSRADASALPIIGAWLAVVLLTGLRRARDHQRSARGRRARRLHSAAERERLVRVGMSHGRAARLRAPRQHPPHAERHRVAFHARGRGALGRRQVARGTRGPAACARRRPRPLG